LIGSLGATVAPRRPRPGAWQHQGDTRASVQKWWRGLTSTRALPPWFLTRCALLRITYAMRLRCY